MSHVLNRLSDFPVKESDLSESLTSHPTRQCPSLDSCGMLLIVCADQDRYVSGLNSSHIKSQADHKPAYQLTYTHQNTPYM